MVNATAPSIFPFSLVKTGNSSMFFDFGFIGKNRSPKKHKYIVRQRRATSGASRTWVAGQSSGHKINKDGEPNQKEKKIWHTSWNR